MGRSQMAPNEAPVNRVRLTIRMSRDDAQSTVRAAREAGLSPGDYVGRLVAGVPPSTTGADRAAQIAELASSSVQLSTLSRNVRHLTSLLEHGSVQAARECREMLNTLAGDVRGHPVLAAALFAQLLGRRGSAPEAQRAESAKEKL